MENKLLKLKVFAKHISLTISIVSFLTFICSTYQIIQNRSIPDQKERELKEKVIKETKELSSKLVSLDSLTNKLNDHLDEFFNSSTNFAYDTLNAINVFDSIFNNVDPSIFGIGFAINPDYAFPFSPFWYRKDGRVRFHQLHSKSPNFNDDPYDYWKGEAEVPGTKWYHQLISGDKWVHPYFGRRAQNWLFEYGLPLLRNCGGDQIACDTIGIVYADYSPDIFKSLADSSTGKTSHAYIVTEKNKVIYYDDQRLDLSPALIDLREVAKAQKDDNSLLIFCNDVVPIPKDTSGVMHYSDATQAGSEEWRIFSKIMPTNWTYAFIYNSDQIDRKEASFILWKFVQIVSLLSFLINFSYYLLNHVSWSVSFLSKFQLAKNVWVFSKLITVYLAVALFWILHTINISWVNLYRTNEHTLTNSGEDNFANIVNYEGTARYLGALGITNDVLVKLGDSICHEPLLKAKGSENEPLTNVIQLSMVINQIDLISANKTNVSGKIMVKYPNRFDSIQCYKNCDPPFYFPNAASEYEVIHLSTHKRKIPRKGRNISRNYYVSTFYFNAKLNQNVNYKNYPFDVLPLELKIQPKDADRELLIPDFDHYYLYASNIYDLKRKSLKERKRELNNLLQSFDYDLRINEWDIKTGFYSLGEASFLQNLNGCNGEVLATPELHHTTIIKRKIFEPLISNFLPIFVIAFIVFIIVLRLDSLEIGGVIGTTVGLFFSLLISHYKLRDDLHVNTVVYIEYYYFLLYIALITFLVNKYFNLAKKSFPIIDYKNNLIAKVIYWPFILSTMILLTVVFFGLQVLNW